MSLYANFCSTFCWGITGATVGAGAGVGAVAAYLAVFDCRDSDKDTRNVCIKNWGQDHSVGYFPFDRQAAIGALVGFGLGVLYGAYRVYKQFVRETEPALLADAASVDMTRLSNSSDTLFGRNHRAQRPVPGRAVAVTRPSASRSDTPSASGSESDRYSALRS